MSEVRRISVFTADKANRREQAAPTVTKRPELSVVPPQPTPPSEAVIAVGDGTYLVNEDLLYGQELPAPASSGPMVIERHVTEKYVIAGFDATTAPSQLFTAPPVVQRPQPTPDNIDHHSVTKQEQQPRSPEDPHKRAASSKFARFCIVLAGASVAAGAAGYLPYKLTSEMGTIGGGYNAGVGEYVSELTELVGDVGNFMISKLPANQSVESAYE